QSLGWRYGRFWHPKNPRLREHPFKLRTQKIAKAIFVPQKCCAFLWALVRSRMLSADFYDIIIFLKYFASIIKIIKK
ncbi:MAG: hypothetical protein NTV63_05880, partial [Candidatus Woesearchaeota archaeon]|nr:hypothetical protein [Candidatus Woesearchaeota archaeon]